MHSLSIAQSILQAALEEARKHDRQYMKSTGVKIGDETFTESNSLQFCLQAMTKGTITEGARIQIELVDTKKLSQVVLELD
ncbi:hydrogenase/urease maturation nickel metallochaperone HypA [Chloroflexota bacterium]